MITKTNFKSSSKQFVAIYAEMERICINNQNNNNKLLVFYLWSIVYE